MVGRVRSTHPLRMQPTLHNASNSTSYPQAYISQYAAALRCRAAAGQHLPQAGGAPLHTAAWLECPSREQSAPPLMPGCCIGLSPQQ
jgi:hypothetical protein